MRIITIDSKSQWFGGGGTQVEALDTWVLHTTEGSTWPGYSGGSMAPNESIMPVPGKGIIVHKHYPETASSMALVNLLGGVQTNRDGVHQSELVGTCVRGGPGYYWPAADDVVLAALADYKRPFLAKYKIPLVAPAFVAYPASFGATPGRMTNAEWVAFRGICGHQHVPENLHGDPGAFPIAKLLTMLRGTAPPPPPVVITTVYTAAHVKALQVALHFAPADGNWSRSFDPFTLAVRLAARGSQGWNVRTVQRAIGVKVDGAFGPISRAALVVTVDAIQRALAVSTAGGWGPTTEAAFLKIRNIFH